MIRYYASIATIKTTEGLLPQSLYRADNDCVEGHDLLSDPLRREAMKEPFWRFMATSGDKGTLLSECSRGACDRWIQLSNKAIAAAKSPPVKNAKIAKPGEVWEEAGDLYHVIPPLVGEVWMLNIRNGCWRYGGTQQDGGILLDNPDTWTCHGLMVDMLAKGNP